MNRRVSKLDLTEALIATKTVLSQRLAEHGIALDACRQEAMEDGLRHMLRIRNTLRLRCGVPPYTGDGITSADSDARGREMP